LKKSYSTYYFYFECDSVESWPDSILAAMPTTNHRLEHPWVPTIPKGRITPRHSQSIIAATDLFVARTLLQKPARVRSPSRSCPEPRKYVFNSGRGGSAVQGTSASAGHNSSSRVLCNSPTMSSGSPWVWQGVFRPGAWLFRNHGCLEGSS